MKALGIIRKIDNLGRLVIPKEIRDAEGWGVGTPLEMFINKEGLCVREYRPRSKDNADVVYALTAALKGEEISKEILEKAIELLKQK
jgi:AbrB family looped-hinge helix DNA binding protein